MTVYVDDLVACGWSPRPRARASRCVKCGCTVFERVLVNAEAVAS